MLPITLEEIDSLKDTDLDKLVKLDKNGLFISNDEDINSYANRLTVLHSELNSFNSDVKNDSKITKEFKLDKAVEIPNTVIEEASNITEKAYFFKINWVPGFYIKYLGFFAGGCSVNYNTGLSFFLLRNSFLKKEKWLFYSRKELLSHELCHIAREPIRDKYFEEFFAYKISTSPLRKYLGNCFQTALDPILFLTPIFLLLILQFIKLLLYPNFNLIFFWILIFIYPVYMLIKNQHYRNRYHKAVLALKNLFPDNQHCINAILFRSNSNEIKHIAKLFNNSEILKVWLSKQQEKYLKWKVIHIRFIP
ncbi:MAG TPA: hypothetical protein QF753_02570 [Victivallales bacterium]|nr:hypothetical protein [Victivallales bacterium]